MNWNRKAVIFIGFIIVFLFAFNANKNAVDYIHVEKSKSNFSVDSIHTSAFIEPQTSNTLVPQKTPNFPIVKYLENYLVIALDVRISTFFTNYKNQDINRCKMVSLLLFPFHYFW